MKILLVYDTKYGNTGKIAQSMKEALAKTNEITLIKASGALNTDLSKFNLVIVGSPTNGGRPSPAVKTFLESIPLCSMKDKKTAVFDTSSNSIGEGFITRTAIKIFGYAAPRIANILAGKEANVIASETFFVKGMEGPIIEGEIERAKKWVKELL